MRLRLIALALLGCGLLIATSAALRAQNPGDVGFPYGDLREVTLQGRLVSLEDELARKYGAKIGDAGEKQWALALPEGRYYTFLHTAAYRKLIAERPAGSAVEVKARLFPRSQLLELLSFRAIEAQVVRRRFFCPVCSIYADDFGPCACCGKELELLKPEGGK